VPARASREIPAVSARHWPRSTSPSLGRLARDARGLSTVEHVLLACLVAVVGFAAWSRLGETLRSRVGGASAVIADLGDEAGDPGPAGASSASASASSSPSGRGPESTAAAGVGAGDPGRDGDRGGTAGRIARGIAAGLVDTAVGAVDGAVALGGAVVDAVRSPDRVSSAVTDALASPGDTARAAASGAASAVSSLASAAVDFRRRLHEGDAYTRARMLTGATAAVIPIGAAGNVARGAGAALRARGAGSGVLAVGRRASKTADTGAPVTWLRGFDTPLDMRPGAMILGRGIGIRGVGVNLTDDIGAVLAPHGVYTVAVHGGARSTTFATRGAGGQSLSPREIASTMIEGGYRGGDVTLLSCSAGCNRLPLDLRRELDGRLAARGEAGRVDTIAAPTSSVRADGIVDGDGHWRLFDRDTQPYTGSAAVTSSSGQVLVGAAAVAGIAVAGDAPSEAHEARQDRHRHRNHAPDEDEDEGEDDDEDE
jgi:Flp pilus assembly pilin Flp